MRLPVQIIYGIYDLLWIVYVYYNSTIKVGSRLAKKSCKMMMMATNLGRIGPGAGQEPGRSRAETGQEQGRSRAGARQEQGRRRVGAKQEQSKSRAET